MVYPFPSHHKIPLKLIPVYTEAHICGKLDKFTTRAGLKQYISTIYCLKLGVPTWLNLVVGHQYAWDDIANKATIKDLKSKNILLFKSRVQDAKASITGIIVGPHMRTFDLRYLKAILKTHVNLNMHPLALKIQPFQVFLADKPSIDTPFIEKMVVVETSA